jgi:hypothetical protein
MEVHHHSHHGKKKWTEYFWEFFMLFLAVTLGFFVENQREHYVEHLREKQYIRSLIADLKVDNQTLDKHISDITRQLSMMDSMIVILNTPASINNNSGQLYYLARVSPRFATLSIDNRTFEQLKNSGNFRLISDLNTSDKIMAYYDKLQVIRQVEGIYDSEFTEYKKAASKIFDPVIFRQMEKDDGTVERITMNASLRTENPELLKELAIYSVYMNGSRRGLLTFEKNFQLAATDLIAFLENEYHLK